MQYEILRCFQDGYILTTDKNDIIIHWRWYGTKQDCIEMYEKNFERSFLGRQDTSLRIGA